MDALSRAAFRAVVFLILIALLFPAWAGPVRAQESLDSLVPDDDALKGWYLGLDLGRAQGEELFELIDGGAEVYLKHGFVEAILATYADEKGRSMNLEIFRMKDPAGAKAVFDLKTAGLTRAASLGDQGLWGDYYLYLLKGPFQIALSADFSGPDLEPSLEALATVLLKRLP